MDSSISASHRAVSASAMNKPPATRVTLSWQVLTIFIVANLLILAVLGWMALPGKIPSFTRTTSTATFTLTPSYTPTLTQTASATPTPSATLSPEPTSTAPLATAPGVLSQGLMVLSLNEGGYAHLFAYSPGTRPLSRLTNNPWDDITPAISPNGSMIAYSSRQNSYWDLYLLNLTNGQTTRLTDSAPYKAHPSWSPDGQWLAYESYENNNFDVYIISVTDPSQPVIQLTNDPAADTSPAWLPQEPGDKIAFVSNRTGRPQIWIADLQNIENRFHQFTNDSTASANHPAWSPDGSQIAWSSAKDGVSSLYIAQFGQTVEKPRLIGGGSYPVFSPDGQAIAALNETPNQVYLSANLSSNGSVVLPPELLPGTPHGLDWKMAVLPDPLPGVIAKAERETPTSLWAAKVTPVTAYPPGRQNVVELKDVVAPHSYLLDELDECFSALRSHLAKQIGWDYLYTLDEAFIPLSTPLEPGMRDDWLYTGRSFAANSIPINAGWLVVVREDFGAQTYWRVYLKTRFQDGSQGAPIDQPTWDLDARFSGDPLIYEQGGELSTVIPTGYWYDLTELTRVYGWERLPAQLNWRTYFAGIRFNQFVYREGLDWQSAMLQLYPVEILITPTPILPPTATPTRTPNWMRPRTATATTTATPTTTRQPTWTPNSP
jgi:TolB protein